ncbi:hypothetical protein RCI39_001040 [Enterobacter hormaechei]|nr:hypothetical protein [Enterobacter hormaechei]
MNTKNSFALAMLISATLTPVAHSTSLGDLLALQNLDPIGEIQQVKRNRAAAYKVDYQCMGNMTIESTGKTRRNEHVNATAGNLISDNGTERTYHEEDESGSSTLIINTKTGQGSYTIMDQTSVLASGNVKCR